MNHAFAKGNKDMNHAVAKKDKDSTKDTNYALAETSQGHESCSRQIRQGRQSRFSQEDCDPEGLV